MAAEVGQGLDLQCFHRLDEEEKVVADKAAQWQEWQGQAETHCLIPALLLLLLQLDGSDLSAVVLVQRSVSACLQLSLYQQHAWLSWNQAWTNQVWMHLRFASDHFETEQALRPQMMMMPEQER